jgi:hypothetical protein
MANRNADASQIRIGPAWWTYKGMAIGYVQGSQITNENSQHETKVDQNGETPIAAVSLGGSFKAKLDAVEINRGMIAAIVPGAEAVRASVAYATDGTSATGQAITFASDPGAVKIGDRVTYTKLGGGSVEGAVAQYDPATFTVTLMDDDAAPASSPSASLYAVVGVAFYNTAGTNLFATAGELVGVPVDTNGDTNVYVLPFAGVNLSADLQFKVDQERKLPLEFTGFPHPSVVNDDGNALAFFMGTLAAYQDLVDES